MNKRGMIKKAVVPIIVIAVLAFVGVIYILKSGTPSLEQLVKGEYSYIYDGDVRKKVEDAFAQRQDELEWVWWDANFDGKDDLILQEKTPCAEGMKRIQGLFCVSDNKIICVMWDDADVTEFYSLCNNKLVYYSQYLGTYTQKVYEVYEYDRNWNEKLLLGLEFYHIENMAEMPADWTTEHSDMQARGAYYQKFSVEENGEMVYASLTLQEWCAEFEKLLGLLAPVVGEDENAYFYTEDYQCLTATVEYYELETGTEKEIGIYNYDVYGAKLEDITYLQVGGMEDKELENKINESLAYVFTHVIAADLDRISYFSDMPIIMFQNEEYLSVKTIIYYTNPNIGGGRLISFPIYQTVSVKTGELLQLDDFVEVSDEFVRYLLDSPEAIRSVKDEDTDEVWNETMDVEIRTYIKEEISAEEMLLYFEEANIDYDTENYFNKCAFYLTDGEINIVHDTGVVDLPQYFKIRLEVNDVEEYLQVPKWFGMEECVTGGERKEGLEK